MKGPVLREAQGMIGSNGMKLCADCSDSVKFAHRFIEYIFECIISIPFTIRVYAVDPVHIPDKNIQNRSLARENHPNREIISLVGSMPLVTSPTTGIR